MVSARERLQKYHERMKKLQGSEAILTSDYDEFLDRVSSESDGFHHAAVKIAQKEQFRRVVMQLIESDLVDDRALQLTLKSVIGELDSQTTLDLFCVHIYPRAMVLDPESEFGVRLTEALTMAGINIKENSFLTALPEDEYLPLETRESMDRLKNARKLNHHDTVNVDDVTWHIWEVWL